MESKGPINIWLDPEQGWFVRRVLDRAGLSAGRAGCPVAARAGACAAELNAEPVDDLRAALAGSEARAWWILSAGPFGSDSADTAAILSAHARGGLIFASEPLPSGALDLSGAGWLNEHAGLRPIDVVRLFPLTARSPGLAQLADVLESFGTPRSVLIEHLTPPGVGSLGAGLFDAMHTALTVLGEVESVDAVYCPAARGPGVRTSTGDALRDLAGESTTNLRTADGRGAAMFISDRADTWLRRVTLIGEQGRIVASPTGFRWFGPDASIVDESRGADARPDPVEIYADRLTRLLDDSAGPARPIDTVAVWSMCQAALLSARTAQGECPATMARMTGLA